MTDQKPFIGCIEKFNDISLCNNCGCMTKDVELEGKIYCGKCRRVKNNAIKT